MGDEEQVVRYLKALLVLQLQASGHNEDAVKPEVLLSRAGLTAKEISGLTGKKISTVAKALQRAGKDHEA